jgi:hypothetical protein
MRKPYELTIIDNYGNSRIPVYQGDIQSSDKILDAFYGIKHLDLNESYHLKYKVTAGTKSLGQYDVLFTTAYLVLFSPKAVAVLNAVCQDQIQMFGTVIECKDGVIDTYKAINILHEVDVSDPEKSVMSKVAGYLKCVFKDEPMEPIHIARDAKFHPAIIISATLKEAFETAKIKGCQYWTGD